MRATASPNASNNARRAGSSRVTPSAMITDLAPPYGSSARACLKVMARASRCASRMAAAVEG